MNLSVHVTKPTIQWKQLTISMINFYLCYSCFMFTKFYYVSGLSLLQVDIWHCPFVPIYIETLIKVSKTFLKRINSLFHWPWTIENWNGQRHVLFLLEYIWGEQESQRKFQIQTILDYLSKDIFNGGWAILETLDSFIHWFIDWFFKKWI